MILQDDKHVFPAGNVLFVTDPAIVKKAGPDYESTITKVQSASRSRSCRSSTPASTSTSRRPEQVAGEYLKESGYIK